jgi:SPP1 gp7 family putative phage head morphogenesis protein
VADEIQFGAPHEEALRLLQGKARVTREAFDRLLPELRARAFTVTGISGFDAMQRIQDSIAGLARGSETGLTWDQAKEAIVADLDELGEGAERRAEILLRTHGFQAFQAANWETAQLDQDTTHLQYLATEDDKVRDTHLALNGIILPKDDPFWDRHMPPWEWGCRCRIRPINPDLLQEAATEDAGKAPDKRNVMVGPAAQQLRQGTLLRDGRRYDVRAPVDKAPRSDVANAWQWHPENLRLPLKDMLDRYDPEVQSVFESWARTTVIPEQDVTVWSWAAGGGPARGRSRGSVPWVFRAASLIDRIRATGVEAALARRYARLIEMNLEIDGDWVVVLDEAGEELTRLPRRILG